MSSTPAEWLSSLHPIIDNGLYKEVLEDRHHPWGFTIYRTCYAPSSDAQWHVLLQTIRTHALETALRIIDATEDDADFQKLWSLFRIDARSDPALYDGLNVDDLRVLYNNDNTTDPPMNTTYPLHRIFLVADSDTFSSAPPSLIKAVDADYRAENHIPRGSVGAMCNSRGLRQRYFGEMLMRAQDVVVLWRNLDFVELERMAPETIGGVHLVVWEGDEY
jgi:hypothetical protein